MGGSDMGEAMKKFALFVLTLTACNQTTNQQPSSNGAQPVNASSEETSPPIPPPATGPDAKTPFAKPPTVVATKSIEAAGQVVQHYGALIERSDWLGAERLWSDVNAARAFATDLRARFPEVHLEIGELGQAEGAAGSIYTTIPVIFYGPPPRGVPVRVPADVVLRRVNDVPGSTAEQRRWRIERIDWRNPR
jgi:hypothetical protein